MTNRYLRITLATAILTFAPACALHAQMPDTQSPKIAAGALVEPSKSYDELLTAFEEEFTGAAKAMPADKYSFAPGSAVFASSQKSDFKGVRTFAQQVTHVAVANYHYASAFSGIKISVDTKALNALTDKDQIIAALAASFVFAHEAVAKLTAKNAFESIHESDTRASLAGGLVAHGYDHYGQMVEYLRMNGITPPASAK